jgi:hypothetical protein
VIVMSFDLRVFAAASVVLVGCGSSNRSTIDAAADDAPAPPEDAPMVVEKPVRTLPGLLGINFWERTGGNGPTKYAFTVDGPELTTHLPDPMSNSSHDIPGAPGEFYDVYYSDRNGVFDIDGAYLTISGVYLSGLPHGGGLNLAEIELVLAAGTSEYGNEVASYIALGDNKDENRVKDCIDSNLLTHTAMGNTIGSTERLRITLGFASTVIVL